jgi:hypothetical protein
MGKSKLEEQFETFAKLAKADKNIDVASLMTNALQSHHENSVPASKKRWAYIVSLTAPPLGLFFALKYWFSDQDDGHDVALICIVLTTVSVVSSVLILKIILSGSGASLEQIQTISPKDIQQLVE